MIFSEFNIIGDKMAQIKIGENTVDTYADLPAVGTQAADFRLTKTDFTDTSLNDYKGKRVILNIFPSLNTGVCQASSRRFNEAANNLDNTAVLCISVDLPFLHKSFCEADGLKNVISLSAMRGRSFGKDYGVLMTSGKWEGLFSRAVVVLDETGKVLYTEQVPSIGQEPNYEAALKVLK
jgi:thioredoxin-dependent peroxiredoxin